MTPNTVDVLDDDTAFRDSLGFLLSAHGFAVTTHDDPAAYLETVSSRASACLICDIRMPGISGLDVVRALGALGLRTRVILITGHADPALLDRALEAGAACVLEKPCPPQRLISALNELLGSDPPPVA